MSGRTLICGKTTGNAVVPVQVNADGTLEMTAEIDSSALAKESTLDSFRTENASNLGALATALDDGTQITKCMGSEDGATTGTQRQLHVDGSGNVQTNVVNTINISPANSANSHITDDPANSVAVGLKARTTIATATTEQFLLCDSDGHLQVDIVSGGGGSSSSTQTSESKSVPDSTLTIIGDNTNAYIDTNGGNKFSICVQSASGAGGAQISIEWSDVSGFTSGNVSVVNGYVAGLADATPASLSAVTRADASTLTNQKIFTYDVIPARYCRITIKQTSGGAITYVGKSYLSP
tara:strand:+ start:37 stop:918 length:882 start_codon:yes stop_codon:yes gene_type:complete